MVNNVEVVEKVLTDSIVERLGSGRYKLDLKTPQDVAKSALLYKSRVDSYFDWTSLAQFIRGMGGTTTREDIRSVCHLDFDNPLLSQGSKDFVKALRNIAHRKIEINLERFM